MGNVALTNRDVVVKMQLRLHELADIDGGFVKPQDNSVKIRALPMFHKGVWAPFLRHETGRPNSCEIEFCGTGCKLCRATLLDDSKTIASFDVQPQSYRHLLFQPFLLSIGACAYLAACPLQDHT